METTLAFGKHGLKLTLPDTHQYQVLHSISTPPLPDALAAIEAALDRPAAGPSLSEAAAGKKSAAISVCDITRPAPNSTTMPPVLRRLEAAGIPRANITILIATGLHRGATEQEIRQIVGPEIAANYRVGNHDARQRDTHRHLGTTRSGTPVWIDERFIGADLHMSLGYIEPHLMLGFSGGRKLVAPGLAKLGIVPIAAHLFIFYFGMLSMVTPPVCMASYAAASIGKTDPFARKTLTARVFRLTRLADDVMVEQDPNTGMLSPLSGSVSEAQIGRASCRERV